MNRINNADMTAIEGALERLRSISEQIQDKERELMARFAKQAEEALRPLVQDLEVAQNALIHLSDDIIQRQEEYQEERSDRWHESDKADEYSTWAGEWESFYRELEDLDYPIEECVIDEDAHGELFRTVHPTETLENLELPPQRPEE